MTSQTTNQFVAYNQIGYLYCADCAPTWGADKASNNHGNWLASEMIDSPKQRCDGACDRGWNPEEMDWEWAPAHIHKGEGTMTEQAIMFVRNSNDAESHISTGWKVEAKCGARPTIREIGWTYGALSAYLSDLTICEYCKDAYRDEMGIPAA